MFFSPQISHQIVNYLSSKSMRLLQTEIPSQDIYSLRGRLWLCHFQTHASWRQKIKRMAEQHGMYIIIVQTIIILLQYSYFCFLHSFLFRSGYLDKGSYLIVPSTTGCKLKKRRAQPSTNVQLASHLKILHLNMAKINPIFLRAKFQRHQRFT